MKGWLGKLFRTSEPSADAPYQWIEVGPGNPYGVRVLDIQSLTQTHTSTTKDPAVGRTFLELRNADGSDLRSAVIESSVGVDCDLTVPMPDGFSEGPLFKAAAMEDKWDIYAYDSIFYFARSWTGSLMYKAPYAMMNEAIRVREIEATPKNSELVDQIVYFLLMSHVLGKRLPNPIPDALADDAEKIALYSFGSFGRRAICATHSDITMIPVADL